MLLVIRPPTHTPRGSSAAARIVAVSSTLLPSSTLRTGVSLYSYYSGGYPTLPSSYRQRLMRGTTETRRLLDRVTHMISPPKRPRETDHLSRAAAGGFVSCCVISCRVNSDVMCVLFVFRVKRQTHPPTTPTQQETLLGASTPSPSPCPKQTHAQKIRARAPFLIRSVRLGVHRTTEVQLRRWGLDAG
jgi:hypothetical protein